MKHYLLSYNTVILWWDSSGNFRNTRGQKSVHPLAYPSIHSLKNPAKQSVSQDAPEHMYANRLSATETGLLSLI